jgi:primosomal protein N'
MVFPDLRTIYNMMDDKNFEKPWTSFLHAKQTQNQKDKERWAIKNGQSERIIASPSEIFQDFKNLEKIIFIDPHKWYYANQQDPRYKVAAVLERMKKIYDVEIEIINN